MTHVPAPRAATLAQGATLLCGVLLLKLVVVWQLADHPLVQPEVGLDTTAYAELARRVLAGDWGLGPGLYYVSPLYIYVLASGLALTDSFTAVRVLQVLAGTLAVGGIWVMTRAWSNTRAAWVAAVLAAGTGLVTFYEVLILQASIDFALTTMVLLALTKAVRPRAPGGAAATWWIVTGVALGLAALNRPNFILASAALALLAVGLTRTWRPALWLVAGLALAWLPVTARNVVVTGTWSAASSHGGLNFYIGNHEAATGFYQPIPGISPDITGQRRDTQRVAGQALGRPVTESEASAYFVNRALAWISDHPAQAGWLLLRKLGFTFNAHHVALPDSYPFYAYDVPTALRFFVSGPWLLIPLGLVGLGVLIRQTPVADRRAAIVWASFVPAYAVSVAVFFVAERYRLPLLVPLCVGSGVALDAAVTTITARRWRALVGPAAACVVLAVASQWNPGLSDGRWEEGIRMTQRLVILKRHDEVGLWIARLAATSPQPGLPAYHAGLQYLVEKDWSRAVHHLTAAQQLDPGPSANRGRVDQALGQALLGAGRAASTPADAEPFFRQGAALLPDEAGARLQYGLNLLLLGRPAEAAVQLTEAVRLDPGDADAHAHLAVAALSLGRMPEARTHAERALTLRAGHPLALSVLAALR
jgi:4-amino-4-deoxy-L-arabinose transferase-like glycosyltransferase